MHLCKKGDELNWAAWKTEKRETNCRGRSPIAEATATLGERRSSEKAMRGRTALPKRFARNQIARRSLSRSFWNANAAHRYIPMALAAVRAGI